MARASCRDISSDVGTLGPRSKVFPSQTTACRRGTSRSCGCPLIQSIVGRP